MKKGIVLFVFSAMLYSIARASNSADVTSTYRPCLVEFYKGTIDANSKWFFANIPFNQTTAFNMLEWQNADGNIKLVDFSIAKKFSQQIDMSFNAEATGSKICQSAVVDIHNQTFGLGILFPLGIRNLSDVKFGPRLKIKNVTCYVTLIDGQRPIYGASYSKNLTLEAAYGKNWSVRVSKAFATSFGTFVPEIRIDTGNRKPWGVAIAMIK